jgi:translation initiation factor 6 (eIF-6)
MTREQMVMVGTMIRHSKQGLISPRSAMLDEFTLTREEMENAVKEMTETLASMA